MPSSVQIFTQAISDFQRLQSDLIEKQSQIGSGSKASTYAELGSDTNAVEAFRNSVESAERFITSIDEAQRKADTAYASIDQIVLVLQDFKQTLALENSPNADIVDLTLAANTALQNIEGALNAKDGPNFLFAGGKTNIKPVNDLINTNNFVNGVVQTNYYSGDSFKTAVDVSSSQRIEYGVTAADDAFKNAIAALNLAKEAEESGLGDLSATGDLLDQALEEAITARATLGNKIKAFEDNTFFQEQLKSSFEQKLADKISPDIVELSIEVAQREASLTASFQLFATISRLTLTDYI